MHAAMAGWSIVGVMFEQVVDDLTGGVAGCAVGQEPGEVGEVVAGGEQRRLRLCRSVDRDRA